MDQTTTQTRDPKVAAILGAAFEAFSMYGFRRTSMEDIAKGAGMSRAALYLHYKNKDDIFRSLISHYYDDACVVAEQALAAEGSVMEQLQSAYLAMTGSAFKALLDSPHGEELMDAKATASGDCVAEGDERIAHIFANWIEVGAVDGRIDYSAFADTPLEVAVTMQKSLHGLKSDRPSYAEFAKGRDRLALMFGKALSA